MSDEMKKAEEQGLSAEELQAQEVAELPDREAMSLVNANVAAPVNLAAALNVLSDNSTAQAVRARGRRLGAGHPAALPGGRAVPRRVHHRPDRRARHPGLPPLRQRRQRQAVDRPPAR